MEPCSFRDFAGLRREILLKDETSDQARSTNVFRQKANVTLAGLTNC